MRKILILFFILFTTTVAFSQTARQLLTQAKKQADPAQQIKILNKAISKAPKMADAYHYRADAYRSLGKNKLALRDYSRTVALAPKDPFRYYARALMYLDMDRNSLAAADLTKAITLKPSYRNFYLARAKANLKLKKYGDSVADYRKYLGKRKPTQEEALDMAHAYLGAYRYSDAEAVLGPFLSAGVENPHMYVIQGRVLANQARWDEAVSYYSKAVNRDASFALAYRYRAAAFKEMQDYPAALEDYSRLLELQPEASFYNSRGLVYEKMGDFKKAVLDYTKAIELNSKWAIPYNNRGFVKMHLKDWRSAKSDLETAIRLDGSSPTPYINLAGAYWLDKKDRKHAYENLTKAVRRNFKDIESLYDENQKGWMFKGLNKTSEFRALLYK